MEFPVLEIVPALKKNLISDPVVILQAPPGAGKSTVLPLQIMNESWLANKKIIMLEPRRLAAKAVAERMANVINEPCGQQVGYRVRFDTKVSRQTRIEVVTEGILTRMLQHDPSLDDAGLIIFDEFHERSIHADLALALTLQIQQVLRPDLRILIMSATFDAHELSSLLGNAPVLVSQGRQYPVTITYDAKDSTQHPVQRVSSAIARILTEVDGDVLVFLPGSGEIRRVYGELEDKTINAVVYPLYGDLPFQKQQEAILPRRDGLRKIVLATAIAETSLTIEGVMVVVDTGLSRVPRFDPRSGLTRLETIRVTKDAADQRAGRAGRLSPGVCYRLWTQGAQLFLQEKRKPEILEADLAPLMLELANWGIKRTDELQWVTPPPPGAINQARELLFQLEAIDEKGITTRGREMLLLPTHPRIAHLILIAREESDANKNLLSLATDIAALLEERDPLDRSAGTDLTLRIEALRNWRRNERVNADRTSLERIERAASNWRIILKTQVDNVMPEETDVGKLLWAAYPERIAQQQGKHSSRYKLWNGRIVNLPPGDPLVREPWICVAQLDAGANDGKIFLAATVHLDDLKAHAVESISVKWDGEREMVAGFVEKRLGPLVLESKPYHAIPNDKRIEVVIGFVRDNGLKILGDQDARESIQARILSLHAWRPEEPWPPVTDEYLLDRLDEWLTPFLTGAARKADLQKLDIHTILRSLLPWDLDQKFDQLAPIRIQVPSGSLIKINYSLEGMHPVVEVRLQEMFGLTETPVINEGRTKVLLHLLSPGFKPVQVTQDLKSFWQTTYHDVRKELRMRYPKHHWPEDPWNAQAVRGAKRRSS